MTVYIDFNDAKEIGNEDFINEVLKLADSYAKKVNLKVVKDVTSLNVGWSPKILYVRSGVYWRSIGKDILIVKDVEDVKKIIDFYLKYDYETLEKRNI